MLVILRITAEQLGHFYVQFHSTYLNGILDGGEVIYMEQPPYHEVLD